MMSASNKPDRVLPLHVAIPCEAGACAQTVRSFLFALIVLLASSAVAHGQNEDYLNVSKFDVAAGYDYIRANAPPGGCKCFANQGGFASAGVHLKDYLEIEALFTGSHSHNISTLGQGLTLYTGTVGPRIELPAHRVRPFGQALVGVGHASDSYFPLPNGGSESSATSFAYNLGGGVDFSINHRLAVRVVDVEYLQTFFPNGVDTSQHHLSVGAGIVFKFGMRNTAFKGRRTKVVPVATPAVVPPPAPVEPPPPPAPEPVAVPPPPPPAPAPEPVATPAPPPPPPPSAFPSTLETEFHANVPDALFDYDSAELRPDAERAIRHAATYLNQHPDMVVLIGGYADDRGSDDYNLVLGEARAQSARHYMMQFGIESRRLEIVSYGKGVRVCETTDEACRQLNRRAAFNLHK